MGEVKLVNVHKDLKHLREGAESTCDYCGNVFTDTSYQAILDDVVVHVGPTDIEELQGNHPLSISGMSDLEIAYGSGCAAELLSERALFLGKLNDLEISPAQRRGYVEVWDAYWGEPIPERGKLNDYLIAVLTDSEECASCTDSDGNHGACTE